MAPSFAATRALPIAPKDCDGQRDPISPFEFEFVTLGKAADSEIYGSCCVVPITGQSPYGLDFKRGLDQLPPSQFGAGSGKD
jgi:hypothetical protein